MPAQIDVHIAVFTFNIEDDFFDISETDGEICHDGDQQTS